MGDDGQGSAHGKAGPFPLKKTMEREVGSSSYSGERFQEVEEPTPVARDRDLYFRQGVGHEPHRPFRLAELISQRSCNAYRQFKELFIVVPLSTETLSIQHKKQAKTGAGIKLPDLKATLSGRGLPVYMLEGVMMTVVAWTP